MQSMSIGIRDYLRKLVEQGSIKPPHAAAILSRVTSEVTRWLADDNIGPQIKRGIENAIQSANWSGITETFWQDILFGTGGIRGRTVLTEVELREFASSGLGSLVLRGTNTINEVVLALYTTGVARYMRRNGLTKVVVGYDSRLHGDDYASLVARVFLANGLTVYLFDEPSPYPELSFAVTYLRADIGIEISASHNDKRYNGYKICNRTGASLALSERDDIMSHILGSKEKGLERIETKDVSLLDLGSASGGQLQYLGGAKPLTTEQGPVFDIHTKHIEHIKRFILRRDLVEKFNSTVKVGYCAFYGAGYKAVPRILNELGFSNLKIVHEMNRLNGYFPAFALDQVVDPGEYKPAEIAINRFVSEYGGDAFGELDLLLGTDPDADRLGVIATIPERQHQTFGKWRLLPADDVWTLLLWYRLKTEAERDGGYIKDADRKFIVRNHVTSDALMQLSRNYGIGCETSWVGFGFLAEKVVDGWKRGLTNIGMFEESNGFSIGGGPPLLGEVRGNGGHTLEKDGTLAAVLLLEVACYAKSQGKSILDLLDEIYLDPKIGHFATYRVQLPEEGVFEGVEGALHKNDIIRNTVKLSGQASQMASQGRPFKIAGLPVKKSELYATGKYDDIYWPGVPDEGVRFYFDDSESSYVTIRPSGTEAILRYYVHLKLPIRCGPEVIDDKLDAERLMRQIAAETVRLSERG
jgi:phosphoglucomutase